MQPNELADLYLSFFQNNTPLLDVRAPVEYLKGAFPHAVNSPLLDDEERRKVGLCYKQNGQDAAIDLGNQLICGDLKQQRLLSWQSYLENNPGAHLYCFRGGLRSRTVQSWLKQMGHDVPLIPGGYKAMRRFLVDQIESHVSHRPIVVIGGKTGVGKTIAVTQVKNGIDLEGLAKHRGSSFGARLIAQPTQIDFENTLAIALLKTTSLSDQTLIFEDEGRTIGRCALPLSLHQKLGQSPLVMILAELEERVEQIYLEYVQERLQDYRAKDSSSALDELENYLRASSARIKKRLGGVAYSKLDGLINDAIELDRLSLDGFGGASTHKEWITFLLREYYDKMYDFQLSKKKQNIVFEGSRSEVVAYLQSGDSCT